MWNRMLSKLSVFAICRQTVVEDEECEVVKQISTAVSAKQQCAILDNTTPLRLVHPCLLTEACDLEHITLQDKINYLVIINYLRRVCTPGPLTLTSMQSFSISP